MHDHVPVYLYGSWNWRNHPDNLWRPDLGSSGDIRNCKAHSRLAKVTPRTEVETRPLSFSRKTQPPLWTVSKRVKELYYVQRYRYRVHCCGCRSGGLRRNADVRGDLRRDPGELERAEELNTQIELRFKD